MIGTCAHCHEVIESFDKPCSCYHRRVRHVGKNRRSICLTCGKPFVYEIKYRNHYDANCEECQRRIDKNWEDLMKSLPEGTELDSDEEMFAGLAVMLKTALEK